MSRYIAALLLMVACGTEPTQPDLRVDRVEIAPAGGEVRVNETLQLGAVARNRAGDVLSGKAFTWSSDNDVFATVTAGGLVTGHAAGAVAIHASTEGKSTSVQVTVTPQPEPEHPVPVLTSLSPSEAVAGSGGVTVTVRGTGFVETSQALWNGAPRLTGVVNDSELRVRLTAGDLLTAGTGQITVFNEAPGGGTSNALAFVVTEAPPPPPAPALRLDRPELDLVIGDTARVRAVVFDEQGGPVAGVSIMWNRLDNGTDFSYYDPYGAPRDSIRVRGRAIGTFRIEAKATYQERTLTDTLLVRPHGIGATIASVGAGYALTCGLSAQARAYCWGNTYPYAYTYAPAPVSGDVALRDVQAGHSRVCGSDASGTVYCWGEDIEGSLGNGGLGSTAVPAPVAGGHSFRAYATGAWHSCALDAQDQAWCWGANPYGQLGDGTLTERNVPVTPDTDLRFESIATSGYHTCGIATDGRTFCWGLNSYGQSGPAGALCDDGISEVPCNLTPALVATELRFVQLAAGGRHTCGLTADGAAWCWGDGRRGQLGNGAKAASAVPVRVTGDHVFETIDAGFGHTCGLTAGGAAWCWGQNDYGNNGVERLASQWCLEGTTIYYCNTAPVAVSGGLSFRQLAVGGYHTCGVTTAAVAYCWGENTTGELGTGTSFAPYHEVPQRVWDGGMGPRHAQVPSLRSGQRRDDMRGGFL